MKRMIALIMAMLLVASLAACGGNNTAANGGSNDAAADDGKYVIGVCQLMVHDALDAATQGFIEALEAELGKENVQVDVQNAAGDSATCSNIVYSFVSNEVDLILANATPALQAAAAATAAIPVLGTSVTEYGVALGIEGFDGLVGGNVSGTSDLAPLDQQAAMVKEWFPEAKNVGLLYCSAEPNSLYQVTTVKGYLTEMGYTCTEYAFADSNDLQAIAQQAADASDVIYVPTDNTVASNTGIIKDVCVPAGVPIIAGEESTCKGCGVASLSINYKDLGIATGKMAAKILKGEEDISQMKIAYADKFTYKYNAEICQELGLTPPENYTAIGE